MKARLILNLTMASLLVVIAIFAYLYEIPHPTGNFQGEKQYLLVRKGESVEEIGENLQELGAISSKSNFVFFTRLLGRSKLMKAGRYEVKHGSSMSHLIGIITRGETTPFNVTIPEGYTLGQIVNLLESTIELEPSDFRDVISDRRLLDSLGSDAENLEGYLAPSTYNLYYYDSPRKVVGKMVSHFFESLPDSFEIKAARIGLTFHQAVTLASLIEKEARLDTERPIISAVYLNRLRKGMRLECDPTVIYAMGGLDRPLLRDDLKFESPYNTYINFGLPPGPIANPGVKSLDAAVNPAKVGYLFFVARGDGSHVFSSTLDDHINATIRIKRLNGKG